MTDDRPPRIRHRWRCLQRGPYLTTFRTDPTGQTREITRCGECGGDDLADRIERHRKPAP